MALGSKLKTYIGRDKTIYTKFICKIVLYLHVIIISVTVISLRIS